MFLIQNLSCFPLFFKGKDVKIPFEKGELEGKFLQSCFVLSSEEDCVILSPFNGLMVTQLFDNEHLHFYLSLVNEQQKSVLERAFLNDAFFSIRNYNVKFSPLRINSGLDSEKSFFSSQSEFENAEANTLIYFTWGNNQEESSSPKISQKASFEIAVKDNTSTPLAELVDMDKLAGRKIKKIECVINESYSPAYLDIFCKDGRRMSYVPASLLQLPDEHEIYFDDVEIDWEKSRFLVPTFNEKDYRYTLTFGW